MFFAKKTPLTLLHTIVAIAERSWAKKKIKTFSGNCTKHSLLRRRWRLSGLKELKRIFVSFGPQAGGSREILDYPVTPTGNPIR